MAVELQQDPALFNPHKRPPVQDGRDFELVSEFVPAGDQPEAIDELTVGLEAGERDQVLLGVTGSGKTFTMAHVIQNQNRPTLVLAPNKTLAAQLYGEMAEFFPKNAVEYFVSYYDYYQPEAYVPRTDTYIEKDASVNEQIDRMRHAATRALLERNDVIIIASVSCIYGIGAVETYSEMTVKLRPGAAEPGEIVHADGRVLGEHRGVIHYTIGQRRGLGVATGEPLFVVKIDAAARRVIVGPREALLTAGLTMEELNWLGDGSLEDACDKGLPVLARVRSTREPLPARLGWDGNGPAVFFDIPEEGVAKGQACVLYDFSSKSRVLGGGFIASTIAADERLSA